MKKPRKSASPDNLQPSGSGGRGSLVLVWLFAVVVAGFGLVSAMNWFKSRPVKEKPLDPSAPLTFHRDIAPIIYQNCSTCHHPGESAPFSLLNYADVKKHAKQIAEVTRSRLMPPWLPEPGHTEFVGERYLTERQIAMIELWVRQGAAEGNPSDAPAPPKWREGWQLGEPDLVIRLPQPYVLAADGRDVYRNFVIPVPVNSRKYVRAVELLPGNAKAVHHAFMLVDPSRDSRRRDEQDPEPGFAGLHTPPSAQTPSGHFMSWQPGKLPTADPSGLAWTLERDTDFVLQMHLRPTGKPEPIQPSVGFYFTEQPPARTPFKFGLWSHDIDIPAGDASYTVSESYTLPVDVDVLRVLPHAHYLGRKIHATARLPDGSERWLIRIDRWDFNWQGDYTLARPLFLPKGSTITMAWTYDNTTNNPRNPNHPPQRVRYGVNSDDEMAELWLQVLPHQPGDAAVIEKDYQPRVFKSAISYNNYLLNTDPRNAKAHTEIGKATLFLNKPDDALRHLRRAIELKPDDDEPHYYVALILRMAGRTTEAKAEFQRTILLNPDHAKAHGNLGLILLNEGNLSEAELHFQSALRLNPEDSIARESLESIARVRAGGQP